MPGFFGRGIFRDIDIDYYLEEIVKNQNKINELIKIEENLKTIKYLEKDSKNEIKDNILKNFDFDSTSNTWKTKCNTRKLLTEYELEKLKNKWKDELLNSLDNIIELRRSKRLKKIENKYLI